MGRISIFLSKTLAPTLSSEWSQELRTANSVFPSAGAGRILVMQLWNGYKNLYLAKILHKITYAGIHNYLNRTSGLYICFMGTTTGQLVTDVLFFLDFIS